MSRTIALLAALVLLAPVAVVAQTPGSVSDSSHVAPGGERVLQHSVEIKAPVARVWAAFTTSEGYRAWAAPVAAIDFRLGGMMEASYDPKGRLGAPANIKNLIVAYVPERMLAFRNVQAPPALPFDAAAFQSLHTVALFEPLDGGRTRLTLAQPGYRAGPAYDGVYRFFAAGNRYSLEQLKTALERPAPAK